MPSNLDGAVPVGSDLRVYYRGANVDGVVLADGDCEYALVDAETGEEKDSGPMPQVNDTPGDYEAVIDRAVTTELVVGRLYNLTITFAVDGYDDERTLNLVARRRRT